MKHVLDCMYSTNKYTQMDGMCRSSIFLERLAACGHHNIVKVASFAAFPDKWLDWTTRHDLAEVPVMHEMTLEMTFRSENASSWEPQSMDSVLNYKIFLVSNEQVIIHCVSNSKNMIADRVQTETRFVLT